jgi:hypoxanthine phosphoribosyltransferase
MAYAFQDTCHKSIDILVSELISKQHRNVSLLDASDTNAKEIPIPDDNKSLPPKAKKMKLTTPNVMTAPTKVQPDVLKQPAKLMDTKETRKIDILAEWRQYRKTYGASSSKSTVTGSQGENVENSTFL